MSKSSLDLDASPTHPAKRLKRAHGSPSPDSPSPIPASPGKAVTFSDPPSSRHGYEHTPPPSPGATESKIDLSSVNDDIVAGVIEQLEKTGNRPHLIKELASILSTTNGDVNR
jgi:hypothetical protein